METKIHQALFGTEKEKLLQEISSILEEFYLPSSFVHAAMQVLENINQIDVFGALEILLKKMFLYHPLTLLPSERSFLFTGLPGSGKTLTIIKLALMAKLEKKSVGILTLDAKKAGALEQIKAYTQIMKVPCFQTDLEHLSQSLKDIHKRVDIVLIDSQAVNPNEIMDMGRLAEIKSKIEGIEPIWVLGCDTESRCLPRMAEHFSRIGCSRVLLTKVDVNSKLGGILDTCWRYKLAFSQCGDSPLATQKLQECSVPLLVHLIYGKNNNA